MADQTQQRESTAVCLYVALELSAQEWLLTMTTALSARRIRVRVAPSAWRTLPEVCVRAKRQLGIARRALQRVEGRQIRCGRVVAEAQSHAWLTEINISASHFAGQ